MESTPNLINLIAYYYSFSVFLLGGFTEENRNVRIKSLVLILSNACLRVLSITQNSEDWEENERTCTTLRSVYEQWILWKRMLPFSTFSIFSSLIRGSLHGSEDPNHRDRHTATAISSRPNS